MSLTLFHRCNAAMPSKLDNIHLGDTQLSISIHSTAAEAGGIATALSASRSNGNDGGGDNDSVGIESLPGDVVDFSHAPVPQCDLLSSSLALAGASGTPSTAANVAILQPQHGAAAVTRQQIPRRCRRRRDGGSNKPAPSHQAFMYSERHRGGERTTTLDDEYAIQCVSGEIYRRYREYQDSLSRFGSILSLTKIELTHWADEAQVGTTAGPNYGIMAEHINRLLNAPTAVVDLQSSYDGPRTRLDLMALGGKIMEQREEKPYTIEWPRHRIRYTSTTPLLEEETTAPRGTRRRSTPRHRDRVSCVIWIQ